MKVENKTTHLEDWIYSDKAQLGLHIVSFDDATFVTISWLHTLLDAMGRSALLRAWQAVLDGREDDVPEFLGHDSDPLADLGKPKAENTKDGTLAPPEEDFVLKDKLVNRLGMMRFIFNYVWEFFWYPVEDGKMLFMPSSYFAKIKSEAFADLTSLDPSQLTYNTLKTTDATPKPFLSDGDILTAWNLRLLARTSPGIANSSPARTLAVMNIFGMRDVLRSTSPPLIPQTGALINNCVSAVWSHFAVQDFLTLPLGHVAARIRKDLVTQGTRAQVEASQRLGRENGGTALFGSGDMALCAMTNWTKAKLFEVDFSAAIAKDATVQKEERKRGRPSYIHLWANKAKDFTLRGSGNCIGKGLDGNWWLSGLMRKEAMPGYVKAVEELSSLG